jgi:hypothetical protein
MLLPAAHEAQQTVQARRAQRHHIFDPIIQRCALKIRQAVDRMQDRCCFEVPEFVLGVPCYHLPTCIQVVMEHLVAHGFTVHYYYPRCLAISWGGQQQPHRPSVAESSAVVVSHVQPVPQLRPYAHPRHVVPPHAHVVPRNAQPVPMLRTKPSGKLVLDL